MTDIEALYAQRERQSDRFLGRLYRFHRNDTAARAVILADPKVIPLPVAKAVPDMPVGRARVRDVVEVVAAYYRFTPYDLETHDTGKAVTRARKIAYFVANEMTGKSRAQIGRLIGGRDHCTILRGIESIKKEMETDARLTDDIAVIQLHVRERLLNRSAA
jgi:hypothetical protein